MVDDFVSFGLVRLKFAFFSKSVFFFRSYVHSIFFFAQFNDVHRVQYAIHSVYSCQRTMEQHLDFSVLTLPLTSNSTQATAKIEKSKKEKNKNVYSFDSFSDI